MELLETPLENSDDSLLDKLGGTVPISSSKVAKTLGLAHKTVDNYCKKGYVVSEKYNDDWYMHPNDVRILEMAYALNISKTTSQVGFTPQVLRKLDEEVNFINYLTLVSKEGYVTEKEFVDPEIADRLKDLSDTRKKLGLDRIERSWLTHLYDFPEDFCAFTKSIYENRPSNSEPQIKPEETGLSYEPSKTVGDYEIGMKIKHDTFGVCEVLPRFEEELDVREMMQKYGKFSPFIKNEENIENEKYNPMIKVKTSEGRLALLRVARSN